MTTADYPIFANSTQYQAIVASQSNAALGPGGGAAGDYLSHLTIVPASTSPGAVSIADGGGSTITVFSGGAASLSALVPFTVAIGAKSTGGAWKVTTGALVGVVACGQFT
jgi:hypothetical protein